MNKRVLALFAHPDDAEFMCSGTLALLRKAGWSVHMASMTAGDKGSVLLPREEISLIRKKEAARSAALLDGTYHCLECKDLYIFYDRETLIKATALIRRVQPDIVFTASPNDYMIDHETTALIVQTACFSAGIRNMEVEEDPFEKVPCLYYSDPMEGKDKWGVEVQPSIYVDISGEIGIKGEMLECHASQRNWLKTHHELDDYILSMKRFAALRGKESGFDFAEGFRQHLGHGYPQENMLKEILGNSIVMG
jgi:LmbE family N-acetylglucosaminyl deacetylase